MVAPVDVPCFEIDHAVSHAQQPRIDIPHVRSGDEGVRVCQGELEAGIYPTGSIQVAGPLPKTLGGEGEARCLFFVAGVAGFLRQFFVVGRNLAVFDPDLIH